MRRLPAASVAASYLHALPTIAGLVGAGAIYVVRPETWPGGWALLVVSGLLALRLLGPARDWLALRYELTPSTLHVRKGLVLQRTRTVTWKAVRVLNVDAPWAYRTFGLSVVSLRSGGDDETTLVLPGVDREVLRRITSSARSIHPPEPRPDAPEDFHRAAPSEHDLDRARDETVVYRATRGQLVLASLAYGRFVVIGAGAILALLDAIDNIGLLRDVIVAWETNPVVWTVGAVTLTMLAGFAVTLVRFHAFEVGRRRDGAITIRYGWISRRDRVVAASAVVGFRVQRNPVEMVLDRTRMALFTTDAAARSGANLVLPSLPRAAAREVIRSLVRVDSLDALDSPRRGRTLILPFAALALVLLPPIAALFALSIMGAPPWATLLAGLLTFGIWSAALRVGLSRLRTTQTWVIRRIQSFVDREEVLRAEAVHTTTAVGTRSSRLVLMRCRFFAGRSHALTAFCRRTTATSTAQLIAAMSTDVAAQRREERAPA